MSTSDFLTVFNVIINTNPLAKLNKSINLHIDLTIKTMPM
jgi:hypothetical protein